MGPHDYSCRLDSPLRLQKETPALPPLLLLSVLFFAMSAGYASRLSAYPNKGVCGLPESRDTPRAYKVKIDALAEAIKGSSRIVIVTGAGISTSAGIPDFRGPKGR